MTTWRTHLAEEMTSHSDPGPVLAVAPDWPVLDVVFDDEYGPGTGPPVLAWTAARVYFPVVAETGEWVGSAPRYPCTEGQHHVGSA